MGTLSRDHRWSAQADRLAGELTQLLARHGSDRAPVPAAASRALAHEGWSTPRRRRRAAAARGSLAQAVTHGQAQQAAKAWRQLSVAVEAEQAAMVRRLARRHDLTAQPVGRAPLFDRPVRHQQARAAWRIYPLDALHGIDLPDTTEQKLARWQEAGDPFAGYYLADEHPHPTVERLALPRAAAATGRGLAAAGRATAVVGRSGGRAAVDVARTTLPLLVVPIVAPLALLHFADPVLCGVISADGHTGRWFALDRWYH